MKKIKKLKIFFIILMVFIISLTIFIISLKVVYSIKENVNKVDINKFKKLYGNSPIGGSDNLYYHGYSSQYIKIETKKDLYLKIYLECALNPKDTTLIIELNQNISQPRSRMNFFAIRNKLIFTDKLKDKYLTEFIDCKIFKKYKSEYPKNSPAP